MSLLITIAMTVLLTLAVIQGRWEWGWHGAGLLCCLVLWGLRPWEKERR